MRYYKSKIKFFTFSVVIFIFLLLFFLDKGLVFAQEPQQINLNEFSFQGLIKDWLEKTNLFTLLPNFYINLTASIYQNETQSQTFIPQPMKDLSTFNLAIDKYYKRPWETSGLVECEPWGVGKGKSVCLAPVFPGDLPCPIFMDCDGDGHYWWKGEDCDENCPTCYLGSKFYTEYPDGRDQDCDGLIDDNVECIPKYASAKTFGYDKNCVFTSNTNYTLINEGEIGEIPVDEIHCQKRWGQCTDYQGGFGECEVKKTPGYFVKSSGIACGGGIWRQKSNNALFDCGKALRPTSYLGYIGCGEEQCCRPRWEYLEDTYVCIGCECIQSPCPTCGKSCYSKQQPYDACFPGNCPMNASFEYGNQASQYGPWALCHGYNEIYCQPMTGCERKFVENRYY